MQIKIQNNTRAPLHPSIRLVDGEGKEQTSSIRTFKCPPGESTHSDVTEQEMDALLAACAKGPLKTWFGASRNLVASLDGEELELVESDPEDAKPAKAKKPKKPRKPRKPAAGADEGSSDGSSDGSDGEGESNEGGAPKA